MLFYLLLASFELLISFSNYIRYPFHHPVNLFNILSKPLGGVPPLEEHLHHLGNLSLPALELPQHFVVTEDPDRGHLLYVHAHSGVAVIGEDLEGPTELSLQRVGVRLELGQDAALKEGQSLVEAGEEGGPQGDRVKGEVGEGEGVWGEKGRD